MTDPIQDMHNAAARSADPAEASVRPRNTTDRQLASIVKHIRRVLAVSSVTSLLDIGCGTGVVGLPLARVARAYVGVDYASEAVAVLAQELADAGLTDRAQAQVADILSPYEPPRFGEFDRVLVYAAAHFVRSDDEGVRFVATAAENLAPAGQALIGSLPLADLRSDWPPADRPRRGRFRRGTALLRWMARRGTSRVPLTRRWKVRFVATSVLSTLSARRAPAAEAAPAVPPGYLIELTTARVEQWVRATGLPVEFSWHLPSASESLAIGRADLLLTRTTPQP